MIAHLKTWRPRPIRERLKTARTILRPLGLRIYTCAPGEYRVAFSGDLQNEAAAYYTADVQDAIDTGIDMHARRARAIAAAATTPTPNGQLKALIARLSGGAEKRGAMATITPVLAHGLLAECCITDCLVRCFDRVGAAIETVRGLVTTEASVAALVDRAVSLAEEPARQAAPVVRVTIDLALARIPRRSTC